MRALLVILLLEIIRFLHASDELGLARIANARVGRFGPVHADSSFLETLKSLSSPHIFLTIATRLNSDHLTSATTAALTDPGRPAPPLIVVTLGSPARSACEGFKSKRLICIKGDLVDSDDASLDQPDLEASLDLAAAHYILNSLSLDYSVLYIDLSRVQTLNLPLALLKPSGPSEGQEKSVDLSFLYSKGCEESNRGQRLAVLKVAPTPAASRCIYDWMVYIWLKRKSEIGSSSFLIVVPECIASVDGLATDLGISKQNIIKLCGRRKKE